MDAEDEALPPLPLTAGQLQPPVRHPPTAVGADDAELGWEDVSDLFPECHLVATRFADQCQAHFICHFTTSPHLIDLRVLVRSAWNARSVATWLARALAVRPLDLPCGPQVSHAGQTDRFAFVGQTCFPTRPLIDPLASGGLGKAPLTALVDSLLGTFAILHRAEVFHGRLTTGSVSSSAHRYHLVDLLDPPARTATGGAELSVGSVEDDLGQLAAIFYTAATGRKWLGPGTAREFLDRSAAEGPLADAIVRMLTAEPGIRFPSAAAFHRGIRELHAPAILKRVFGSLVWQ